MSSQKRAAADVPERHFYSRPTLRDALFSIFFLPFVAVLAWASYRDRSAEWIFPLLGAVMMLAASLWLVWRRSLPWQGPALIATKEGLHVWPQRRNAAFMPWSDLESVGSDPSDHILIFHPKIPGKYEKPYLIWLRRPPFVPEGIKTRDGEYFVGVLEDYLPDRE